jgi:hypothetical protein
MMFAVWFLLGAVVSAVSVASHWLFVKNLKPGSGAKTVLLFILGILFRLAVAAVVLVFAVQQGLAEALCALAGMIICLFTLLIIINARKSRKAEGNSP